METILTSEDFENNLQTQIEEIDVVSPSEDGIVMEIIATIDATEIEDELEQTTATIVTVLSNSFDSVETSGIVLHYIRAFF